MTEVATTWIGDHPLGTGWPHFPPSVHDPFQPFQPFQPFHPNPGIPLQPIHVSTTEPLHSHGCICPPTSEQTCRGDYCPRQPAKPFTVTCGNMAFGSPGTVMAPEATCST